MMFTSFFNLWRKQNELLSSKSAHPVVFTMFAYALLFSLLLLPVSAVKEPGEVLAVAGSVTETNIEWGFDMDELLSWLIESGRQDVIMQMCYGPLLICQTTQYGTYYEVKW